MATRWRWPSPGNWCCSCVAPVTRSNSAPYCPAQTGPAARLGDLLAWMEENLNQPLPIGVLAARACLSPRQFARVFQEETGTTPARMVERMRVEAARRRLEHGRVGLVAVAASCGFGTEETMRRSFLRQVGVTPGEYRDRFRKAGAPASTSKEVRL